MPIVIILSFDDWGHRWGVHELFLCLAYARARYEQEFSLDTPTFTIWEMDKFMEDICDITLESTANKTFDVTMESGSEWHLDTSFSSVMLVGQVRWGCAAVGHSTPKKHLKNWLCICSILSRTLPLVNYLADKYASLSVANFYLHGMMAMKLNDHFNLFLHFSCRF